MKFAIIIPVYNEEKIIASTLGTLTGFLAGKYPSDSYEIMVVDNASADRTGEILKGIASQNNNLKYLRLEQKGKGLAIKSGWEKYLDSDFEVLSFMDADLSTDLSALPALIDGAYSHDLCIGNRFHPDSRIDRSLKRRLISHSYRLLAQTILDSKISDFPCGFKAIKNSAAKNILPLIQNQSWFFDNELAYWSEKKGLKIKEIPVDWKDFRVSEKESKVNVASVSFQYLKELNRLRKAAKADESLR